MEIKLSKYAGFCSGVKRAIDTVMNLPTKNTYIYGNIIHNESVLLDIKNKGIITIEDLSLLKEGDTIVIRSHGVGEDVFDYLNSKNVKVIDCTCPFVNKTQKIVKKHYDEGYQIVIVGKTNHPEVIGLNGWCNNTAIVLEDENFTINLEKYEKVCLVAQTTCSNEKFKKILEKINQL